MGSECKTVLHLINAFHAGGAEILVCRMAPLLLPYGYRAVVVSLSGYVDELGRVLIDELEDAGIEWHLIGKPVGSGTLRAITRCARHIQRCKPNIVHTHCSSPDLHGGVASRLVGGVKYVSTLHNTRYDSRWFVRVARHIYGLFSKPHYIAISGSVAAEMEKRLGISRNRMDIVPNGVDDRLFTGSLGRNLVRRDIFRVSAAHKVIVSIGTLIEQKKNFSCLIRAFASVVRERSDFSLFIFGEGKDRQLLEAEIENLGISEYVSLPGVTADVPAILRSADLFVLPSAREGFGLVAIEAMMAGLPVILSDVDGLREMADKGAPVLTFPPGNVQALANQIRRFLESPELMSRFGQAAKTWAIQNHSLNATVKGYVSVYNRLLES